MRDSGGTVPVDQGVPIVLSCAIGSISFAGSIIAFLKLQELMTGRPIHYPGQQIVNALIAIIIVVSAVARLSRATCRSWRSTSLLGGALLLGVLFVLPIGGADMPVVISLLNSFTGSRSRDDRLRARQQRADHQRRARRRVRYAAHGLDGQSDESLDHQRALRCVRRGREGGRRAPAAAGAGGRRAQRKRRRYRASCSRTRKKSSSFRATAWPSRKRSTSVRELADQLEKTRRRSQVRDPSGRGTHARTHERLACRSQRAVHLAVRHGRHQPGIPARRRRARHRRQRRHESRQRATSRARRSTACRFSTSTKRRTSSCSSAA